jgi:UDPglucose--hexose-1-phosphate uridylyltransferase
MPELRKDPILNRWVIIATERAKRPTDFIAEEEDISSAGCPFCPGAEEKTPPEIFAFRKPDTKANTPGWQVRVVSNKFPALRIEGEMDKMGIGIYDRMNGIGAHEVIIENPDHDKKLEQLEIEDLTRVFEAYKERLIDLKKDHRFRYILLFKNEGKKAGASLSHPHSQLIAVPVTPKRIREKLVGAQHYYEYKDRCIFCDIVREELSQKVRLVYENSGFMSFCPFASRFPFEIWVMPKFHSSDFDETPANQMPVFAEMMKVTLSKLTIALGNPAYNYILNTAPVRWRRRGYWTTLDQDYHWHIEIIPRLTNIAGFEWGTGFYINPTIPEEAAAFLQETSI